MGEAVVVGVCGRGVGGFPAYASDLLQPCVKCCLTSGRQALLPSPGVLLPPPPQGRISLRCCYERCMCITCVLAVVLQALSPIAPVSPGLMARRPSVAAVPPHTCHPFVCRYVDDEVDLCQMMAIVRHVGRKYGLVGKTEAQQSAVEEVGRQTLCKFAPPVRQFVTADEQTSQVCSSYAEAGKSPN